MKAPELTALAIDWLKAEYPDATIVTEMSVADWGNARIDVAAITDKEMIGVEIKGEGDSPTRLELQGLRYGQVARFMWLLPSPEGTLADRCLKKKPQGWGKLEVHDGAVRPKNTAVKLGPKVTEHHITTQHMVPDPDAYQPSSASTSTALNPWAMCGTLWRDELFDLAVRRRLNPPRKALVSDLTDLIVDHLPVPAIHDAMIDQLRRRVWKKPVIDLRPKEAPVGNLFSNRKAPERPIK